MHTTSTAKVAIIVPNWNGADNLYACLKSLTAQTASADIIVVDNGSVDNSVRLVRQSFPNVLVLEEPVNKGFAGGVNVGIRHALDNHEYIALFNNDAVADPGWVENLSKVMDSDQAVGITTGLLLSRDGTQIDTTGEQYSIWGLPFPRQRGQSSDKALAGGKTFGATGGASLYRSSMLRDLGLFDESFFAYYEDTDLSFRAQLKGYRVIYTPFARAYHEHGTTSRTIPGFTVMQTFKNLPLLYLKNVPFPLLSIIGLRFWTAYVLMFLNAVKNGNGVFAAKGTVRSVALIPHSLIERRRIQRTKIVSAAAIMALLWNDLPPEQRGIRCFRKIITGH